MGNLHIEPADGRRVRGAALLKGVILLFWVVMMGLLVYREAREAALGPFATVLTAQDLAAEDAWYGIYFLKEEGGKESRTKIGYSHQTRTPSAPGYILRDDTRLRLTVQKDRKNVRTKMTAAVDADYRLISFDFELTSDLIKFRIAGEVRGRELQLDVITAGEKHRQAIPLPEGDPSIPANLPQRLARAGLRVGEAHRIPFFDPSTMAFDTVRAEVAGKEMIELGGVPRDVFRIVVDFKGLPVSTWIDEAGNVLKERSANMESVRETREYAVSRGWGGDVPMDVIDMAAVRTDREIPRPRQATWMKVRLSGADLEGLPLADARQTLAADGTLVVTVEDLADIPAVPLPTPGGMPGAEWLAFPGREAGAHPLYAGEPGLLEFLRPTPTLQADDPEIIETARRIVGGRRDALAAAQALSAWVFETLEKKPIVSIPSAKDVLDIKRGDCNEHAALLTALARAAGIPAKILVGLVYNDGSFYYHAWNAFWVGRWVTADATFGQFPPDATHIKVLEGDLDQQVAVARLIGQLRIEVLEVR